MGIERTPEPPEESAMTRLGISIVVVYACVCGAPVAAQQSIETEIRAVHAQMSQAAERLEAEALFAFVLDTDTPPIIEDGRVAPTRTAAHQNTAQGLRGLTRLSYTYTRQNITVISPTTVLWVGEGTASATLQDGREIAAPFAETIVFVRLDNQWKVLHAHRSAPAA
jgi:ketosteroid isomerase-like protein